MSDTKSQDSNQEDQRIINQKIKRGRERALRLNRKLELQLEELFSYERGGKNAR